MEAYSIEGNFLIKEKLEHGDVFGIVDGLQGQ
jgi:hypothetical protein